MGYQLQYDNSRTANFLKILELALAKNANDVINEAKETANHHNRVTLATNVLRDPAAWAQMFKDGIAMQGVTDASTDAAFDTAIGAVWSGYAGITFNGALSL